MSEPTIDSAAADEPARAPDEPLPRTVARDVNDRVILYVIRGIFFLIAAGIGLYSWRYFFEEHAVLTILTACGIAIVVIVGEIFFSRTPIRTLAAISFGLMMGLVLSLVFQPVVELILNAVVSDSIKATQSENLSRLMQLVTTTVFCYYGISLLLQTRDDFKFIIPYVEFRKDIKSHVPLIVDTSMIIDGRISALLETRILDQRLIVPRFVLDELQTIADSPDRGRRERGRRGMDVLQELRRHHPVEIVDCDRPPGADVDQTLVTLAEELGGKLLTTDFNLQKRARLQGVQVININDLATALKPVVVPGETVRVRLLREGDAPGQAVGFLADGTMVVVESASRKIGEEVTVEVTSATQTSAGKMVFGRVRRGQARRGAVCAASGERRVTGKTPAMTRADDRERPQEAPPLERRERAETGAILVAAGSGTRFGEKKQFLPLAGRPLLLHSLDAVLAARGVREAVVVAPASDVDRVRELVAGRGAAGERGTGERETGGAERDAKRGGTRGGAGPPVRVVAGGARRQDSVRAGLEALAPEARFALVHDAARPLIDPSLVESCIDAMARRGAAACGHPSSDSVKEEMDGTVARSLARERIWLVQTPQGGRVADLLRALDRAAREGLSVTDEVSLLELVGVRAALVEGPRWNLKITFPGDLELAEFLLARRRGIEP